MSSFIVILSLCTETALICTISHSVGCNAYIAAEIQYDYTMLSQWLGNPIPWHGHYYTALALPLVAALQFTLLRFVRYDATAGVSLCSVALLAFLVKLHVSLTTVSNASLLFAWGVRVAIKGIPSARDYIVPPPALELALNKTCWIWLLSAPTVYGVSIDEHEIAKGTAVTIGIVVCLSTLAMDYMEKNTLDGTYCRNPYAFSSVSMAWGLFLLHTSWYTVIFPTIFSYIVMFAHGGTAWCEARRRARDVRDTTAHEYHRTTSPFFPMPPGVYVLIPRGMKRVFCLDF